MYGDSLEECESVLTAGTRLAGNGVVQSVYLRGSGCPERPTSSMRTPTTIDECERRVLPPMKTKYSVLLVAMVLTVVAPLCGVLPGCNSADNPQLKQVPNLNELASKIKPEPTKIGNKVVDYSKKSKYMEAMGKRNKQNP
jgi:hypothetical protein